MPPDQMGFAPLNPSYALCAVLLSFYRAFDKLYSDTFSMMRETVSDMRRHMWPTEDAEHEKAIEETEKKADKKIDELKETVENRISELLKQQRLTDSSMSGLRSEMRNIVEHAIASSRQVELEAREETAREHILRTVRVQERIGNKITIQEIANRLRSVFELGDILRELTKLKEDGYIELSPDILGPDTEVRLRASQALARRRARMRATPHVTAEGDLNE